MASGIELELIEASGFEPRRNLGRQDYLAALARAIHEIDEADFDAMSVEAQDWFNDAVRALNKKQELPDFPDAETEGEVVEAGEDDLDPTDDNPVDDSADEEAPAKPAKATKPAKAAKAVKGKKAKAPEPEPEEVTDDDNEPEPEEVVEAKPKRRGNVENLSFNKPRDRWGFIAGTKNSVAMDMFEKGCRMPDVTEALGGSYYNALSKAVKAGHTVEKASNGLIKLTHSSKKSKGKK